MPESVCLNISGNSDDPILEFDDLPKPNLCDLKYLAFIFLLIFPISILALEIYIYPFPSQIDAYKFCDDMPDMMISRSDYRNYIADFNETEEKLLSIKSEMSSPDLGYDVLYGYAIAKEMLEEHRTELEAMLKRQRNLWNQCITQNVVKSLIPVEAKIQLFIQNIICLTILGFFISFLVYGSSRSFFYGESRLLFNLTFILQSCFIVLSGILFFFASICYSKIWNLNSNKFMELL